MFKYIKEYRFYIILFMFVLIPVMLIDTSTRAPRDRRFYDRAIVGLTYPVQALISWSLEHIASGFQNYVYLFHTRQDNQSLLDENRKLLNEIASLRETQQENLRLRRLLHFEERLNFQSIVARVVARDVSTEFRAIRINRGDNAGLRKNMAVVTNEGVVGRILRTTATTADVVTIMDSNSAVDSIDERSRARGVVEGMTDESCQLRYVLRTDDIQPGDVMISSGLGGIIPKGVPVGTVSRVNRKPFGITQDVEIKPSVDFTKLEEVLVITSSELEPVLTEGARGGPSASANGAEKAESKPTPRSP
jgi:rod shape-determining protein MreC